MSGHEAHGRGFHMHAGRTVFDVEHWHHWARLPEDEARRLGDLVVWLDRLGLHVEDRSAAPVLSTVELQGFARRMARNLAAESGGVYRLIE